MDIVIKFVDGYYILVDAATGKPLCYSNSYPSLHGQVMMEFKKRKDAEQARRDLLAKL